MLQNAYSLAKIGADTAENERTFAENLPKYRNYPTAATPDFRGSPVQAGLPRSPGREEQRSVACPRRQSARLCFFKFRLRTDFFELLLLSTN